VCNFDLVVWYYHTVIMCHYNNDFPAASVSLIEIRALAVSIWSRNFPTGTVISVNQLSVPINVTNHEMNPNNSFLSLPKNATIFTTAVHIVNHSLKDCCQTVVSIM